MWWAQMRKLFGFVTDYIEAWIISDQNQSSDEENLISNTGNHGQYKKKTKKNSF